MIWKKSHNTFQNVVQYHFAEPVPVDMKNKRLELQCVVWKGESCAGRSCRVLL